VKVPEPAQEPATPAEPQKVVLKPPKQQRVRLQPKVLPTTNAATSKAALNQTRKARRIKLTMANLSHRFTRAKKVKEHTEKESVDSVRDYLVKKGVIQAKSKAPEKMLRSMYADFMLLKDQAL
jgi:RNA-splicing ligase RtcB